MYVVGSQKNRLSETVLLTTHNIHTCMAWVNNKSDTLMACLEYEIMKTGALSHLSRFLLSPAFTLGEGMSRTELSNNKHMKSFIDACIICQIHLEVLSLSCHL